MNISPKLEIAEDFEESLSFPGDEEFKETIKNAQRKFEIPAAAPAMLE